MEKKKRKIVFRTLVLSAATVLSGYITSKIYFNENAKEVVSVPESVGTELLENNNIDSKNNDELINTSINTSLTDMTNYINIDLQKCPSLLFLKKFKHINTLSIDHPEYITNFDIEIINSCNIDRVNINATSFSRNIILKEEIDLNRINNLHLYVRNEPYDMEVFYSFKYEDIFRYEDEYYKNDTDLKFKNEDVYEMKQWLININNSLGILKDDDEKTKTIKIANYLCKNMHYDEDVLDKSNAMKADLLSTLYNMSPIREIYNQNEENKSAICINYSIMFELLCYLNDIECRTLIGEPMVGNGHAWNAVRFKDGSIKYIDVTSLDADDYLSNLISLSCSNDEYIKGLSRSELEDYFFLDEDFFREYRVLNKEVLSDITIPRKGEYYNKSIDGKKVLISEKQLEDYITNMKFGYLMGFLTSLSVFICRDMVKEEEEEKKKTLKL